LKGIGSPRLCPEVRIDKLMAFTHLSKYDLKLERCVGVTSVLNGRALGAMCNGAASGTGRTRDQSAVAAVVPSGVSPSAVRKAADSLRRAQKHIISAIAWAKRC